MADASTPGMWSLEGIVADILTRIIGMVAPGMAIKRMRNQYIMRHYMAASKTGPNKAWLPTTKTADEIIKMDRAIIVARARDLVRNSSHVAGAIEKLINNVVYTGIHPQAQFRNAKGELNTNRANKLEEHWEAWAGAVNYYDIQSLVMRHRIIDGECLVLISSDPELKRQGICPLWLEVLEADYLDTSRDREGSSSESRIKGGIEYDKRGRPAAYYILKQHPGAQTGFSMDSDRIPAERIIHFFCPERASQTRGVSKLTTVIMEMRDFHEYQSSERIAARLAAAFGVFVESPYPEHSAYNPIMQDSDQEALESAIPKYLESGRIDVLPPGMKISVAENKRPGTNYADFSRTSLRGASAGTGLSYETFSNDYSEATYSSARAATLEERRGYRVMQDTLNRRFNAPIWRRFREYLHASGIMHVPSPVQVVWQNPGWPWVDPQKDAKAAELELQLGITTRRKLAAERGQDWDEVVEELAAENNKMKDLGVEPEVNNGGNNNDQDPERPGTETDTDQD